MKWKKILAREIYILVPSICIVVLIFLIEYSYQKYTEHKKQAYSENVDNTQNKLSSLPALKIYHLYKKLENEMFEWIEVDSNKFLVQYNI